MLRARGVRAAMEAKTSNTALPRRSLPRNSKAIFNALRTVMDIAAHACSLRVSVCVNQKFRSMATTP